MRVQRLNHCSIRTTDLDETIRTVPSLNIHLRFFEDPRGVTRELDFPFAEASGGTPA